jgi:hypothetical protein
MLRDEWLDAKCTVLLTFLLTFSGHSLSVKMTDWHRCLSAMEDKIKKYKMSVNWFTF